MNGRTSPAQAILDIVPGTNWQLHDSADLNGDNRSDLEFQNTATNQIAAWLMDGATITASAAISGAAAPAGREYRASGDLNADGNADLLFQHTTSGAVAVWAMAGTSALATAVLAITPVAEWLLVDAGDLNGDARADLVFQNSSANVVASCPMDGATITQAGGISGSGAPAGGQLQAAQDVGGDDRADLIFQNASSGAVAEWQMNGLTAQSTALLSIVPGNQ